MVHGDKVKEVMSTIGAAVKKKWHSGGRGLIL